MRNERPETRWGRPSPVHDPRLLHGFAPRGTDVLITTAPKAGTTWMQQILHQLRAGGDDTFESIFEVVPWLEWPSPERTTAETLAFYESLPGPRCFKTHCTFEQTPGVDTVRLIMTSRDPRDCCVSFYHHRLDMTEEARERMGLTVPRDFEDHFEAWMETGSWWRNVCSWWPERHRENLLWLRYADLVRDLPGAVDRVLAHVGWTLDADARARALERCSFAWMKANQRRFVTYWRGAAPSFAPRGFIRRGRVGEHREVLTAAQERRILERCRERCAPECLDFVGLGDAVPALDATYAAHASP